MSLATFGNKTKLPWKTHFLFISPYGQFLSILSTFRLFIKVLNPGLVSLNVQHILIGFCYPVSVCSEKQIQFLNQSLQKTCSVYCVFFFAFLPLLFHWFWGGKLIFKKISFLVFLPLKLSFSFFFCSTGDWTCLG